MTGKYLFLLIDQGKMPPRVPFVPTIYEHAAVVIGKTPSQLAQDEDLIVEGQLACYDLYKHDLISVGVDIYNVECEALGAKVVFHDNIDMPCIGEALIKSKDDLRQLAVPDPEKAGRMPLFLSAVERINNAVGNEVVVSGTVVGPFTLAAILRGFENFIMDMLYDADFATELMNFAKEVGLAFAKSFIKRGVGLSINESWIAPPLLSPELYKRQVFSIERAMIDEIKAISKKVNVALISGGNTTSIASYMVKTGTSLLMADYNSDQEYYKKLCWQNGIMLRASIESKLVESGTEEDIREATERVFARCGDYERFIFGCGVVSYGTPISKMLMLKRIVQEINRKYTNK